MPSKVSELGSLGGAAAANDWVPVVDVSDTSQDASGSTKKLAGAYIVGTDGDAATVTGGGTIVLGGHVLTISATGTASLVGHDHGAADIVSGTFDDARIAESNVTQHQAALSLTESQISDLGSYAEAINELSDVVIATPADNEVLAYDATAGEWQNQTPAEAGIAAASHDHGAADIVSGTFDDARIAESNVTQHQAALSLTESQISDMTDYEPDLGSPASDGLFLKSTAAGVRTWGAAVGPTEYCIHLSSSAYTTGDTWLSNVTFIWRDEFLPAGYTLHLMGFGKCEVGSGYMAIAPWGSTTPVSGTTLTASTNTYTKKETAAITLTDDTLYHIIVSSQYLTQETQYRGICLVLRNA